MNKQYYVPVSGAGDVNALSVRVYYDLGGFNYFTYQSEPRGYYLSVSPVGVKKGNGYWSESFTAFSGRKWLVTEVARRSEKRDAEALEAAMKLVWEKVAEFERAGYAVKVRELMDKEGVVAA